MPLFVALTPTVMAIVASPVATALNVVFRSAKARTFAERKTTLSVVYSLTIPECVAADGHVLQLPVVLICCTP